MAAHPKNKITRVERGKRRAGNTPKLKKDTNVTKMPLHKRTLASRILGKLGLTKTAPEVTDAPKHHAEPKTVTPAMLQSQKPAAKKQAAVKTVRKTQHKG